MASLLLVMVLVCPLVCPELDRGVFAIGYGLRIALRIWTLFLRVSGKNSHSCSVCFARGVQENWFTWEMTSGTFSVSGANAGFHDGYMLASVYGGCLNEFPTFCFAKVDLGS